MPIVSHNPTKKSDNKSYEPMTQPQVDVIIRNGDEAYRSWKVTKFSERAALLNRLADIMESEKETLSQMMAIEMGKPVRDGVAEVEKCALCCRFYAENGEGFLNDQIIKSETSESYVRYEPLGVILAVMPWNYPLWQVIRFAAPTLMTGNTALLKHASNVPQIALKIEELFRLAGFPEGVFQTLLISSDMVESVISNPIIQGVSLTGSEAAGRSVASLAGESLKKSLLELGGSDPFIVMPDADISLAIENGVKARMLNGGQSCIAAKRFIVHESIINEFIEGLKARFESLNVGNPLKPETEVGPLANSQIMETIIKQVAESVQMGAKVVTGGMELSIGGYFYAPTIIKDVTPLMPVFREETFGPVAAIISFNTEEEAIGLANSSNFGLGASIWTSEIAKAKIIAAKIEAGSVFINNIVRSDPRLPFGGIKNSGYGRELGSFGIKEFTNIKSVVIA